MKRTRDFDLSAIDSDKRLIVYGAGRYGELAYWGLKSLGISVDYFMDKNRVGGELFGIPIISPSQITEYHDDVILIASYNYYNEILEYLIDNNVSNIFNISALLDLDYDESVLSEYIRDEKNNRDKYRNVVENECGEDLVINHCELVVTEKCTLRCRDCANLIQYYNTPHDADASDIETFGRFVGSIDELLDWRILGGEPFCYPKLAELIDKYAANPKIKRTTVYTNSTLLPSPNVLKAMRDNDVVVHMSNYGVVSTKVEQLDALLTENGIMHYIHDYFTWNNLGGLENRNYSLAELENVYNNCVMSTCYTFHRGRFWICPRAAHGEQLGYYKASEDEYVDFNFFQDDLQYRKGLKTLMLRRQAIEACKYCNGFGKDLKEIKAAVQCRG